MNLTTPSILGRSMALLFAGVVPALSDTIVLQQDAEIRYNGVGTGLVYDGAQFALLAESDPNANTAQLLNQPGYGGGGLIDLAATAPNDQRQLLISFDGFVGPEPWQIPPHANVVDAVLQVPMFEGTPDTPDELVLVHELLHPWDPNSVTWNNYGVSPNNGVNDPADSFLLPPDLIAPVLQIDLTPLVQGWVHQHDTSRGIALSLEGPGGSLPRRAAARAGPRLPPSGQRPQFIPSGTWGVRHPTRPFEAFTHPKVLGAAEATSPTLLITFELPNEPLLGAPHVVVPTDPSRAAIMAWQGRPGMDYDMVVSEDLDLDGPNAALVRPNEVAPGQFIGNFPIRNNRRANRFFGQVIAKDNDGDGLFDNRGGAAEDDAGRALDPIPDLSGLFDLIERLGRLVLAADSEKERNALVQELRTSSSFGSSPVATTTGSTACPSTAPSPP